MLGRKHGRNRSLFVVRTWRAIHVISHAGPSDDRARQKSQQPFISYQPPGVILFLQCNVGARPDYLGNRGGAPVGQADAAVGFGLADRGRDRGAVNAVVRLGQVDPGHAHRVVGAGGNLDLLVARLRIPEQLGIVVVDRVGGDTLDLPVADRQWVALISRKLASHRKR
jgi:hypothetical protein